MAELITCHHCGGSFRLDLPPDAFWPDLLCCRRCGHGVSESPPRNNAPVERIPIDRRP